MSKHILCALVDRQPEVLEAICRVGRKNHWLIEHADRTIYRNWHGDGVISDYLSLKELKRIRNFSTTPIVSRQLASGGNIRGIHTDTRKLAGMVIDYFQSLGFSELAIAGARKWPGELEGIPQDPGVTFEELAAERGLSLACCYWAPDLHETQVESYDRIQRKLEEFFKNLHFPAALFVKNRTNLNVIYRVLETLEIKVPDDLAILCNSDSPLLTENAPVPTSYIAGEPRQVGTLLAETLERMIDGEEVPEKTIWLEPHSIVIRESTATLVFPNAKFKTAVDFLHKNASAAISVVDAAEAAGISASMLNRLFQKYLHTGAYDYLAALRMNEIRRLLAETDLPLAAIAARTGYSGKVALSTAFRNSCGVSPGQYRRQNRRSGGS